jgi:hypothetical protein
MNNLNFDANSTEKIAFSFGAALSPSRTEEKTALAATTEEKRQDHNNTSRTPGEYIAQNNSYSNILFNIMAQCEERKMSNASNACWSLLMNIPSVEEKKRSVCIPVIVTVIFI